MLDFIVPEISVTQFLDDACDGFIQRLRQHPFIQRCRSQQASWQEMACFLEQHGKYGEYFTRYLCTLMGNLPERGDVVRLAENLAEEMGYGDHGDIPHAQLYAQMMTEFGLNLETVEAFPETESLIQTMLSLCRQPGGAAGLGALCLGAEAIVAELYADLVQGFVGSGVVPDKLTFFHLHMECDDDHALTMRDIIIRMVENNPAQRLIVLNAAEVAIQARLRFFDGITKRSSCDK